ncbi:MAG: TonB-dependent receptor [Proteobacteria bacterium]|nr:TonB-dependent receptor [Pseudomonadota bacterium]
MGKVNAAAAACQEPLARHVTRIGFAVASALAAAAMPQRAPAAGASDSASTGLQEVVVTARKREENLQDVPISINVYTKDDLQKLGIASFDDYAYKVPSVSFISVGPGTQLFVMRGVADGSNPNYANTSATGFYLDDMSLSWGGTQPDLHLYDMEAIEILNGPQGTTFGAGAMAGAVRNTTVKPDVNNFSAGVDFTAGAIHDGRDNWTYEGFLNVPLVAGALGLRVSAFSDSQGGFIDNQLTTRTWVNTAVSNNADWARNDYNRMHLEGGRIALKALMGEKWFATLTYSYQRQSTLGAWDEDPTLPARTVQRFGPESHEFQAKTLDFHLEGDVGIGDLVFASTYWSLPTRQHNEYSQYMENYLGGAKEGVTCTNDPVYGTGPYTNCNPPVQYFEYHTNPERWSDELRLQSKSGGRLHWLGGLYWEKTRDKNSGSTFYMPGLRTDSPAFKYYNYYYNTPPGSSSLPPGEWYAYTTRTDYKQTTEFVNINFDITSKLNVEAGTVHFKSDFSYYSPYGQLAYAPTTPYESTGGSTKWNSRFGLNYKATEDILLYGIFSQGFRDGGSNSGYPAQCYANGVPEKYVPDTLNNYEFGFKTRWLANHLVWNGAVYQMDWKDLQTIIYDVNTCPPSSFNANVGDAKIKGVESNIDYKLNENWSMQAAVSYTDSRLVSSHYASFQELVGERLPYVPYFSYSANIRYEHPLSASLHGYAQFDIAHKGDMWNDLHKESSLGIPRILQPEYSLMNLRIGLLPASGHWLAELFCTNCADKNAIIYSNTGNYDLRQTTNEPRVIGLRLNYRFGKEVNAQ